MVLRSSPWESRTSLTNKGHFRVSTEGPRGPFFCIGLFLSRAHGALAACIWCVNRTLSSGVLSIPMFINTMFVNVCPNTTNDIPVFI